MRTALEHLSLSYKTFESLIHLQPCPLAAAPALRCLRLGYSTEPMRHADAEALAAALPGLRHLELCSPARATPLAAPEAEVLERLQTLAPQLALRTISAI